MRNLFLGYALCLLMILGISATASRVFTFTDGQILTASQLNNEFDNLVSVVNNLDEDNISASANFDPSNIDSSIAGDRISASGSGVLSVDSRSLDPDPAALGSVGTGTEKSGTETGSTSEFVVSNVTLTTRGSTVMLVFGSDSNATSEMPVCTVLDGETITIKVYRDGTQIHESGLGSFIFGPSYTAEIFTIPQTIVFDQPSAGTYDYELRMTYSVTGNSCDFDENLLYAVEL